MQERFLKNFQFFQNSFHKVFKEIALHSFNFSMPAMVLGFVRHVQSLPNYLSD